MINKQGPGKIDWTDWTWNPISGCLHGCSYCYMSRMEKRFPGMMEPKFHPERIEAFQRARKVKSGDKVFVGSSGDMWGTWVPDGWISAVLGIVKLRPDITFQFLTKNPISYKNWFTEDYPNCWFGTTIDGTARTEKNLSTLLLSVHYDAVKFVSFEPLLSPPEVHNTQMAFLDWIIIGANSNRGAQKPPNEWAKTLINMARTHDVPVWVKDNYGYPERIKEFPKNEK